MNLRLTDARASVQRKAGRTLLTAGAATFCCVIVGAVIAFGTTLVVSNTLGEAGAGVFFQIVAYFAIATALATFGADTGLVRAISAAVALGRQRMAGRILLVACIPVAAASLLVAGLLYLVMALNVLPGLHSLFSRISCCQHCGSRESCWSWRWAQGSYSSSRPGPSRSWQQRYSPFWCCAVRCGVPGQDSPPSG